MIYSDPGSQLVHTSKELRLMWNQINKQTLLKVSTDSGLQWVFGPADSPWYQGAVEALVKSVKRCFKFSLNSQRLSSSEFSTFCYEVANVLNERPIGYQPADDSEINILTPNCLLLGRPTSTRSLLQVGDLPDQPPKHPRLGLVHLVCNKFWERWKELIAPTMVKQQKWRTPTRNFQVGDIVMVADANALKSQYFIAQVKEANPDKDGVVRKVLLRYKNHKVSGHSLKYTSGTDMTISRSVQRLALIVPVEE